MPGPTDTTTPVFRRFVNAQTTTTTPMMDTSNMESLRSTRDDRRAAARLRSPGNAVVNNAATSSTGTTTTKMASPSATMSASPAKQVRMLTSLSKSLSKCSSSISRENNFKIGLCVYKASTSMCIVMHGIKRPQAKHTINTTTAHTTNTSLAASPLGLNGVGIDGSASSTAPLGYAASDTRPPSPVVWSGSSAVGSLGLRKPSVETVEATQKTQKQVKPMPSSILLWSFGGLLRLRKRCVMRM
mmetsp:Transcript_122990/g.355447  ORF Transcript_122990/g.355447 Transcript_122990/m.355447 type:complete len:243 (-) Transcript_122990:583-1311(-)